MISSARITQKLAGFYSNHTEVKRQQGRSLGWCFCTDITVQQRRRRQCTKAGLAMVRGMEQGKLTVQNSGTLVSDLHACYISN